MLAYLDFGLFLIFHVHCFHLLAQTCLLVNASPLMEVRVTFCYAFVVRERLPSRRISNYFFSSMCCK